MWRWTGWREKGMCPEGLGCGDRWDDVTGRNWMAIYQNIVVRAAAAFGSNDVGVVASSDFVDDADETFLPTVLMIISGICIAAGFFRVCGGRMRWVATGGIREAWLGVGYTGKIEGQSQLWDLDGDL